MDELKKFTFTPEEMPALKNGDLVKIAGDPMLYKVVEECEQNGIRALKIVLLNRSSHAVE